jgi:hypothetical protein
MPLLVKLILTWGFLLISICVVGASTTSNDKMQDLCTKVFMVGFLVPVLLGLLVGFIYMWVAL